jgi:hypothetical protein
MMSSNQHSFVLYQFLVHPVFGPGVGIFGYLQKLGSPSSTNEFIHKARESIPDPPSPPPVWSSFRTDTEGSRAADSRGKVRGRGQVRDGGWRSVRGGGYLAG